MVFTTPVFQKIPKRVIFLLGYTIVGLFGLYDLLFNFTFDSLWLILGFHTLVYTIGHQLLLHRYFAHRQFKVNGWLHKVFCFMSTFAGMGSPLVYRFDHRVHHTFSDTKDDIHGPMIGLFRGIFSYKSERLYKLDEGKINDDVLVFVHKNYYLIQSLTILFVALFGMKVLTYFCLAVAYNIHISDIFNYLNHTSYPLSYRNYDTRDNSTNHPIWGYFTICWHNNHHQYPFKANEQVRWWEIDILYQTVIRWIQK